MFKFLSKFAKFGFAKGLAKGKLGGALFTVDVTAPKWVKWVQFRYGPSTVAAAVGEPVAACYCTSGLRVLYRHCTVAYRCLVPYCES
jgi:hypothetical protein